MLKHLLHEADAPADIDSNARLGHPHIVARAQFYRFRFLLGASRQNLPAISSSNRWTGLPFTIMDTSANAIATKIGHEFEL
jgi:hypothetical protein